MTYMERLNYLDSLPNAVTYFSLSVSAFVENVFPAFPGGTITIYGAFPVGAGRLDFVWFISAQPSAVS